MNDRTLRAYHALPPVVRSMVATGRGYYLRLWRYGRDTERIADAALARESWSADRWTGFERQALTATLRRAAAVVPFYREHWAGRRAAGDAASLDDLHNWPILDKETLRQSPRLFLADDRDPRRLFREHTSGTTGKPVDLWASRDTLKQWYGLSEARWRRWYGVSRHDRWAMLGGQLIAPVAQRQPPFWVWNGGLNQLYMSSYHLAPALIGSYLEALAAFRVQFLLGYTSSLYALAQEALRLGRRDLTMKVVIANAEPVFDYQREAIEEAFGCGLRETYGMSEMVAAGSECDRGRLHLWPEVGHVEVLDHGTPVPEGTVGDLVCTGLLNDSMMLVRYRLGDRGTVRRQACACGHGLPHIVTVEGRFDDVLYFADGRQVGRLDPVFKMALPVKEAQIIQETLDRIRIRYVPAPGFTPAAGQSMIDRLQDRVGRVGVVLEAVDDIPRSANGKFRAVVCRLPADQLARARAATPLAARP